MSHIPMILKNAFCFPSIGLYLLNIDGTPKVDENGLPIPVYTNDEIMSLYVFPFANAFCRTFYVS